MKVIFSSLIILLFSIRCYSQLEINVGGSAGSAVGIRAKPYNDPFLDLGLLAKVEVGFIITDWFHISGFISGGSTKKSSLNETMASSTIIQYGLSSRTTVLHSGNYRHNLDLGLPVSYITQDVDWQGYNLSRNASGEEVGNDKASFFAIGLQPSYRFHSSNTGFTYTLGVLITHLTLIKAEREVYSPENAADNFTDSNLWHQPWNLQAVASIGYRF